MRDQVRAVLRDDATAGQCFAIEVVFTGLPEAIEELERTFPQHVLTFYAGNAFHRPVPGRVPELAIESKNAVDVSFEKTLEEQIWFFNFV